jgi:hypothetical protein
MTPEEESNRIKLLEDYIYRLEQEVSDMTKEVMMWRHKHDPTVKLVEEDDPF